MTKEKKEKAFIIPNQIKMEEFKNETKHLFN